MSILRGHVKVNVGCGKWNFGKGWDHIDMGKYDHVLHANYLLTDYKENSVNLIYSSHFLEYLDWNESLVTLKRWNSVLKKGAKLQLALPDFRALCQMYLYEHYCIDRLGGPLLGRLTTNTRVHIEHKQVFDLKKLSKMLHMSGFTKIKQLKTGFYKEFEDCSWAYLPDRNYEDGNLISLNVECYKA